MKAEADALAAPGGEEQAEVLRTEPAGDLSPGAWPHLGQGTFLFEASMWRPLRLLPAALPPRRALHCPSASTDGQRG